jgi:hypothetical protein
VVETYDTGHLYLLFRRQLMSNYLLEWNDLYAKLGNFQLQPLQYDIIIWRWHSSGLFSVHSFMSGWTLVEL